MRIAPFVALATLCLASEGCLGEGGSGRARSTCKPCVASVDCSGEVCSQLSDDSVCARTCNTDADCGTGDRCVALSSAEGISTRACLAADGQCGAVPEATTTPDAGAVTDPACAKYQLPEVANTCCKCAPGRTCAPNGCYGGWVCDTSNCRCAPLPSTCGEAPPAVLDALRSGGPISADVTVAGGRMDRLHFAVVGDTRPAVLNDTAHYPTAVVRTIFTAIQNASPRPAFVLTTGDYVFASPNSSNAAPQLDLYLQGRATFTGPMFPAYGNHECDGYTASNCGPGIGKGETQNYKAYVTKMLTPLGETKPYFSRRVDASDGSWTSKVVVVATNSWNAAQGTWLEQAMSEPTTYTFVVRHVPTTMGGEASPPAPGLVESEAIIQKHPFTLELEGHAHTWIHRAGSREVIIGNGGAPVTTSMPFGFTVLSQRADGAIVVTNYDASTTRALFTFAVKADGTPAP